MKMSAYQLGGVDASKDRSLPGRALRQPVYAEARIGFSHNSLERQPRLLSLKYREELGLEAIKRIVFASGSYTNSINENQKH